MDWSRLLSERRLGKAGASADPASREGLRTEFFKDWDRLVFSTAFRRLQDKTQVVPLADNDYVRNRLTHSLEVASVGRSLGALAGHHLLQSEPGLRSRFTPHDIGSIVAAACLMHDIGNPPFGHEGEHAIQTWFRGEGSDWLKALSADEALDFLHFEGNAQGLRTVVQLQYPDRRGGLQLTCATLGAFTKYPRSARAAPPSRPKFGFMASETSIFAELAGELGLNELAPGAWARHPLAYLLEAADDICYCIVDVEDAVKMRLLSFDELQALHEPFLDTEHRRRAQTIQDLQHRAEYLRAITIGVLVQQAAAAFEACLPGWMSPQPVAPAEVARLSSLCDVIPSAADLAAFRHIASRRIYADQARKEAQWAAVILPGVLAMLAEGLGQPGQPRRGEVLTILSLTETTWAARSPYARAQTLTDFVAGMTDRYALSLYQRWYGSAGLPG